MPPRWITGTIVGFWLVTTGWLLYREIAPRYRTGEPPPFAIDLTDEVGATDHISWNVLEKGEGVGLGTSWVRRRDDRTFMLYSDFRFTKEDLKLLSFRKVSSWTHVNAAGELLDMAAEVEVEIPFLPAGQDVIKAKLTGRVDDHFLIPEVTAQSGGQSLKLPLPHLKIKVSGNVLNPMLLVNKYRGVHAGQTWPVPLLDPTGFKSLSVPLVHAEVSEAVLDWQGNQEPCYRIDYREPGKKVTARTWVRKRGGFVLQQEAEHQGRQLILQRDKAGVPP